MNLFKVAVASLGVAAVTRFAYQLYPHPPFENPFPLLSVGEEEEVRAFVSNVKPRDQKLVLDFWMKKLAAAPNDFKVMCPFENCKTALNQSIPFDSCNCESGTAAAAAGFYRCEVCGLHGHTSIAPYFVHPHGGQHQFTICLSCALAASGPVQTAGQPPSGGWQWTENEKSIQRMETFKAEDNVVVISDLHIASKWFTEEHKKSLAAFMKYLDAEAQAGRLQGLVILGDAFETWSIDEKYHTNIGWIKEKSQFFIDAVRDLANDAKHPVKVVYIMGNHDDILADADGKTMKDFFGFNSLVFCPADLQFKMKCGSGIVMMEHGHRHDMFNSYLPQRQLVDDLKLSIPAESKRPIGYYITRADYSRGVNQTEPFGLDFAVNFTNVLSADMFAKLIVSSLSSRGVNGDVSVVLPEKDAKPVNLGEALKKSAKAAYTYFDKSGGAASPRVAVQIARSKPIGVIPRLYNDRYSQNIDALIYGHFHTPEFRSFRMLNKQKVLTYANTGSWGIDSHDVKTYIRLDGRRSTMQLCEWQFTPTDQKTPAVAGVRTAIANGEFNDADGTGQAYLHATRILPPAAPAPFPPDYILGKRSACAATAGKPIPELLKPPN